MEKLIINGGKALRGRVKISGAKNAVLPIIAAALLGQNVPSKLEEVPALDDVHTLSAVLEQLGAQMLFAGVAQKPGSPMLAAEIAGKLVFCLSGNPFAAAATLEQYAVPALLRAAGRR